MTAPVNVAADHGEREAFEAKYGDVLPLDRSAEENVYLYGPTQFGWEVWQASAACRPAAQGQALTDAQIVESANAMFSIHFDDRDALDFGRDIERKLSETHITGQQQRQEGRRDAHETCITLMNENMKLQEAIAQRAPVDPK